jgi:hypothetical protein
MNKETVTKCNLIISDLDRYKREANLIREICNGLKNTVVTMYYYNGHGQQDIAANTQFSELFPFDFKKELKILLNDAYDIYLDNINQLENQLNNLRDE